MASLTAIQGKIKISSYLIVGLDAEGKDNMEAAGPGDSEDGTLSQFLGTRTRRTNILTSS